MAEHFTEPSITGVDMDRVTLKRAVYERKTQALIVSILPGYITAKSNFKIINLDPSKTYQLYTYTRAKPNAEPVTVKSVGEYKVSISGDQTYDIILMTVAD